MDCDPETVKCFFDDLSQKSQTEIHLLLKNLKHIGFADDVIERLSHDYYRYFQDLNRDKDIVKPKIKRTTTTDLKRSEIFNDALFSNPSSSSAVWIDPTQKELSPSVEPSPES